MKILVALSGGIDSSVVAHMLHAAGHELIGVCFLLWPGPLAPAIAEILPSKCCTAQNAARAGRIAKDLGIPYHVVDLSEEFKRMVVDPYMQGHRKGVTPNPCIGCNRTIKFGKLIELMEEYGCEKMATGHYARVAIENSEFGIRNAELNSEFRIPHSALPRHLLLEAIDKSKDQSYYLYGLSQEQLSKCLFPLGTMRKADVYALAKKFGVPFDDDTYRESQDLCFFPEKSPEEFLKRHLQDALQPGPIVRRDGMVVGSHEGLPLYTIGQRRGLGVGGLKIPLEVVSKDIRSNALIVEEQGKEQSQEIRVTDLAWVSWNPEENVPTPFEYRSRSLSPRKRGTLTFSQGQGLFRFQDPSAPATPGQSLVLYRGEEIVGGGTIA